MEGSKRLQLNKTDGVKIAKGAGIAGTGAIVSYIIVQVLPNLDANDYAWLIPMVSAGLNALQRWLMDHSGEQA